MPSNGRQRIRREVGRRFLVRLATAASLASLRPTGVVLHVLPQAGRIRVALVASRQLAGVGFLKKTRILVEMNSRLKRGKELTVS